MPLNRMRFEILGETMYSRAFEAYAEEVRDMSEPLAQVGEQLRLSVSEQFRTEGVRGAEPWQRLNAAYARWKLSVVGPEPILVLTGAMRHAMTSREALHVSPHRLVYEPDDEKAVWHQTGAGNLPPRKMVDLTEGDRRQWDHTFAEWLNGVRHRPLGAGISL